MNASLRVFATAFGDEEKQRNVRIFINPVVVDQSSTQSLGKDPDDPDLEGCLSIKGIYAPVPRYTSITYQFLELEDNNWREKTETFYDFPARVMQHEFDHLEGILFTDYVLKYELPAHMSDAKTDKLVPIKHDILEMF